MSKLLLVPNLFRTHVVTWLLLGGVIWLAHFYQIGSFGFYEDDYALIAPYMKAPTGDVVELLLKRAQFRPVGFFAAGLLTKLGYGFGGITGIYILAFLLIWFNAVSLYRLIRFCLPDYPQAATVAALTYALYPADTTKILLTHSLILQVSVAFLLTASYLYMKRRYVASYLVICGSLLSYESGFVTFLALPLLAMTKWDRDWRKVARHIVVMGCLLATAVAVRKILGEGRIAELSILKALSLASMSVIIGPLVNVKLFFQAMGESFRQVTNYWIQFGCFLSSMILLIFNSVTSRSGSCSGFSEDLRWNPFPWVKGRWGGFDPKLVMMLFAGLSMLGASYLLSFTHFPPTAAYGRMTSVHLCASVAGAVTTAACWQLLMSFFRSGWLRWLAVIVLALSFSLLAGYHGIIQTDYAASWRNQKHFWRQVTRLVPDLRDGTVIWVLGGGLPQTKHILTSSWADIIVLRKIYRFPREWINPPRLLIVESLDQVVRNEPRGLVWDVPAALWAPHSELIPQGHVILLEERNGRLERVKKNPIVQGMEIQLQPDLLHHANEFPHTELYSSLIESEL